MPKLVKVLIFVAVLLTGLLFHLRNDQMVTIDYYLGIFEIPFSLTIVLSLTIGVLLGVLVGIPSALRLRRDNARIKKQLDVTEKEIKALRVIPVEDIKDNL